MAMRSTHRRFAYVGCRTTRERHARGEGLSVFEIDAEGGLHPVQLLRGLVNPSYLALNAAGTRLYVVHGDTREVSAFRVDRATGHLSFLNRQDSGGLNPVHLALLPDERALLVTNHLGASLAVLPLDGDGALGPVRQLLAVAGPVGPHRIEQKQPKPHYAALDPSGRFVLVPDKGCDRIHRLGLQPGAAAPLQPLDASFVALREGAGPRHMALHPRQPRAYVVNELDSTVVTCALDTDTGALQPLQWRPTLPPEFTGNSRAAGIALDARGRHLYVSNRGHDSIALLHLDADSGLPAFVEAVASGGRTPRFFALTPEGDRMLVLNEDSDAIVTFAVDARTGRLTPTGQRVATGSPVCLVFSPD
jgi:6-phosphogluconolactonase (cycloisomerase 2 family)